MKNYIDKDNSLLPLCLQDTKKGKELRSEEVTPLIVILHLIIGGGGLLLLIITIAVVNTSRTNTKSSQLSRSQRVKGVRDGWLDRDVRELKDWLIPLTVDSLLVAPHNLKALLQHIQALIHVCI
jgi:hypothetical protein